MTKLCPRKEVIKIPYKGSSPKSPEDRVNRNPHREATNIDTDEEVILRGPELPDTAPGGIFWCTRAKEVWETWRKSPQAKLMLDTDWDFMLDTIVVVNECWRPSQVINGKLIDTPSPTARANYLAEVRQRVGKFGATFEDRQKLNISIRTPQSEEEDERKIHRQAAAAVDYAERLNKAAVPAKRGPGRPRKIDS